MTVSRRQYASGSGDPASATFSSAPNSGNLLIAISSDRSGGVATNYTITGTDWVRQIARETLRTNGDHRRCLVVWYKIAGESEPTNIQVDNGASHDKALLIQEFEGDAGEVFEFLESASNDDGATYDANSLATGTTASVSDGALLEITAFMNRLADAAFSNLAWSADVSNALFYVDDSNYGRCLGTGFGETATGGTKSSTASWAQSYDDGGSSAGILVFSTASGGSTSLVVADASHAHTAESPALTVAGVLALDSASHDHTAEVVDLQAAITLAINDGQHGHTADTPSLAATAVLSVDDSSHSHTADSPALTVAGVLALDSASHDHTAEVVDLQAAITLTIDDGQHGHTADSPALTVATVIVIDEAGHNHTAEEIDLTISAYLTVSDSSHAHTADNVSLGGTGSYQLEIANSAHGHTADSPAITVAGVLALDSASHVHTAEVVDLQAAIHLAIDGGQHGHTADNVTLVAAAYLVITDSEHAHTADEVTLITEILYREITLKGRISSIVLAGEIS